MSKLRSLNIHPDPDLACPICGSLEVSIVDDDVVECDACGETWQEPWPIITHWWSSPRVMLAVVALWIAIAILLRWMGH